LGEIVMAESSPRVPDPAGPNRPLPERERARRRTAALRVIAANRPGEEEWARKTRGRQVLAVAIAALVVAPMILVAWLIYQRAGAFAPRGTGAERRAARPPSDTFPGVARTMALMQPRYDSLRKAVRTRTAFEDADRVALAAGARRMITLAEVLSTETKPARRFALPQGRWTAAVDRFGAAADELARRVEDPGTTQAEARRALIQLQRSCTECHAVFQP
jgi:hypothetical protein